MPIKTLGLTSALAIAAACPALSEPVFNRVASLATPANMAEGEDKLSHFRVGFGGDGGPENFLAQAEEDEVGARVATGNRG